AGMLRGVFHLHEQEARQVMTPIPAVVTVDVSADVKTALERCITTGHTRLLVIEDENPDRVRGIVHASRLARALTEAGARAPTEPLVRDAPIVPATKPLDDPLAQPPRRRTRVCHRRLRGRSGGRGPTGALNGDRPAGDGPVACFWEEVLL